MSLTQGLGKRGRFSKVSKPNGAKPPVFNFTMKNTTIIVLSCMMILCGCASQRDMITLDNRQALIEKRYFESQQKNKELTTQLNAQKQNNKNLRSKFAEQRAMIESLSQEIQILSGRLEETEYVIKQKLETYKDSYEKKAIRLNRIDQTSSKNKGRLVRLEQYLNFESTEPGLKGKKVSGIKTESRAEQKLSEDAMYQSAKQAFDQGDFESAREGFQKFIKNHPKSKNVDNAQFWIGEIYYHDKWYEKAILEYQKVVEKYPKGNKVQASLLKQGFSFFNLGDKANARLIFTELIKKYPKSNEAKIAKKKLKVISH
ncbi:MAG: tol-pal system protein YbgF [Deltaproteobacteria bacterium]|nr:tol-pal system protein YbgF [Deltaproteobacteria bacterium]